MTAKQLFLAKPPARRFFKGRFNSASLAEDRCEGSWVKFPVICPHDNNRAVTL